MKKMNNKNISHYKNLSNYWDITDGTIRIEELEKVKIEAEKNINFYVLSDQDLILYLQGLLDLKQVQ